MNRPFLTGTQSQRETEILKRWLSFSPITHQEYAISGVLYTVPIGQYYAPEININSGSYEKGGQDFFEIKKDVHLFEDRQVAVDFIRRIGKKNITTIGSRQIDGKRWTEVQLINYPNLDFSIEIEDLEEREGYRIEIEQSSSFGYHPINREVVMKNGRLVSDTYLKFFSVETDK